MPSTPARSPHRRMESTASESFEQKECHHHQSPGVTKIPRDFHVQPTGFDTLLFLLRTVRMWFIRHQATFSQIPNAPWFSLNNLIWRLCPHSDLNTRLRSDTLCDLRRFCSRREYCMFACCKQITFFHLWHNINNLPGCFHNRRGLVVIFSKAGGRTAGMSGLTVPNYARTGQ